MFNSKNEVHVKMARAFNHAVSKKENINTDGSINWNFVDGDVYLDMAQLIKDNSISQVQHYKFFDFLADAYCEANGIQS